MKQKTLMERFGRLAHCNVLHLLEAEGAGPKQPTEVDRIRDKQKLEVLQQKQRQSSELLSAQQRELGKKTREKMAAAQQPKPKA